MIEPAASGNARSALHFAIGRQCPGVPGPQCWAAMTMRTCILAFVSVLAVGLLVGCHRPPATPTRAAQEEALTTFKGRANRLYDAYLTGDRDEAKHNLEECIQLAHDSKLPPAYQAGCLFFDYARLYVLERRGGNEALAEAALVKARYWSLRERELGGNTDEKAGAVVKAETGEQIMGFIDKWDKDHTDGKGPNYAIRK
jgi:hypothetical protein